MQLPILPKTEEVYVIDTSSLIAMAETYPPDIFPGVWKKVEELINEEKIISVEDVYEELKAKDDDIYEWARIRKNIFKKLSYDIQESVKKILKTHSKLIDIKNKKSSADPFVIATARVHSGIVVTEENPRSGDHKPKIPHVCRDYDIDCINLLKMFQNENLKLK